MNRTIILAAILSFFYIDCTVASQVPGNVVLYATGQPASSPSNLKAIFPPSAIGTSQAFDVYVKTDVRSWGISLDVFATGDGVKLTSMTFPNPSGPRWSYTYDGIVASDGKSVMSGFTFGEP